MQRHQFPGLGDWPDTPDTFTAADIAALAGPAWGPSEGTTAAQLLASYPGVANSQVLSLSTPPTFTQWITTHSTVLLVGFAAVGALMAIAGGRRR